MKRITVFILAILYISTSTGVTLHMHYCMGQLKKTAIQKDNSAKCEFCGMKKSDKSNKGCCKDEQKLIKNFDAQNTAKILSIDFLSLLAEVPFSHFSLVEPVQSTLSEDYPLTNSPPSRAIPIYLSNRSILI